MSITSQALIKKHHIALNSIIYSGLVLAALSYCIPSFADEDNEIGTLDEAMEFVLSEERVPNASEVKLKDIHATYSDEMKVWIFSFIDGVKTHIATVDKKSRFSLETKETKETKDSYNELFWADLPRAEGMIKKDWLFEAENFMRSNKYSLTNPKILNYKVCDSPISGAKSKYSNGCNEDVFKQTWSIASGIEDRKLAKMIVYGDGKLESFSDVTVEFSSRN